MNLYFEATINGKNQIFHSYEEISKFCTENETEPTEIFKFTFDMKTFKMIKEKLI